MITVDEILMAKRIIDPYIRQTPLDYSYALSKKCDLNIFFKCENLQYTGSFKVRGAINKILSLSSQEREQGVVTASSGNHGAAVAFSCKKLNIDGLIFLPENVSHTKVDNIRNHTSNMKLYGKDCVEAEMQAITYSIQHNRTYVSPYNDRQVITGQGTIGVEIASQLDRIDAVFVPIGGGGLISGVASYLKAINSKVKIIGCLPKHSPVMAESIKAGKIIEMETLPTLSDATAGGIESGSMTFELCRQLVDDYILVTEKEVKDAIQSMLSTQHMLIEGASALAVAAVIKTANAFQGKNVVVILSGANISVEALKSCLDG